MPLMCGAKPILLDSERRLKGEVEDGERKNWMDICFFSALLFADRSSNKSSILTFKALGVSFAFFGRLLLACKTVLSPLGHRHLFGLSRIEIESS